MAKSCFQNDPISWSSDDYASIERIKTKIAENVSNLSLIFHVTFRVAEY